jgi:hypothetical protein
MTDTHDKVLIYAGPSLDSNTIAEQLGDCDVLLKPPVKHGDFASDVLEFEPTHILILDGLFHHSLSLWHKEVIWALQIPGVKGIYGASSMGALRAADLADYGVIGCGKIFNWFYEGIISDESEVACVYGEDYKELTIPLVNVRGALLQDIEGGIVALYEADYIFSRARAIHWTERTIKALENAHPYLPSIFHDQKKVDALELLCTFRDLEPIEGYQKLGEEALSGLFAAQFERDRSVDGVKLQDLDAYIMLHDAEYEQHAADSDHRQLALLLADVYRIQCSFAELDQEWQRFNLRMAIRSQYEYERWIQENHSNAKDLLRMLREEVRLRKLRRALMVRSGPRRRTQRLLDYFKLSRQYKYWVNAASAREEAIRKNGGEEALSFGGEIDVARQLNAHAQRNGLAITCSLSDYTSECGFGSARELMLALSRDQLGEKTDAE